MEQQAKTLNSVELRKLMLLRGRIETLTKYLEERYFIKVPEGYQEELEKCVLKSDNYPTKRTVDTLVRQWHLWKEYLSPDSYAPFILNELKSLFRIQVSAVSGAPALKSYVGEIPGVTMVKIPPKFYSSCMNVTNCLKLKGVEI